MVDACQAIEIMTDRVLGKSDQIYDYLRRAIVRLEMEPGAAIAEKDMELFQYADTPDEAFKCLKEHLTEHHLEPTEQEAAAPGIAKTRG